jgi:hypothetical protein
LFDLVDEMASGDVMLLSGGGLGSHDGDSGFCSWKLERLLLALALLLRLGSSAAGFRSRSGCIGESIEGRNIACKSS